MSFLPFFHGLIADGTIPYGNYAFAVDNGKLSSGGRGTIASADFVAPCIQKHVVDIAPTEGARVELISLRRTFEFVFTGGKWVIQRNWTRPAY